MKKFVSFLGRVAVVSAALWLLLKYPVRALYDRYAWDWLVISCNGESAFMTQSDLNVLEAKFARMKSIARRLNHIDPQPES